MIASTLSLPTPIIGRRSAETQARYEAEVLGWCEAVKELQSRLDFQVSTRGWCYLLEPYGLAKGDFDKAEALITSCRKRGILPLDICADDASRDFDGLEKLDEDDPADEARLWIATIRNCHLTYVPVSFWDDQPYYLQLLVEKVDLKSLFADICELFHMPRANAKGWSDLNSRAKMMRRFKAAEERGQIPVLLYCGDFDPAGLLISDTLRSNLEDLAEVVGWHPENLVIDRFGLNRDFIDRLGLTWIDGLKTGSGNDLANPAHKDHGKPYVQSYLAQHGARKVEANALVANPDAGRTLMAETILKYLPADAPQTYERGLAAAREAFRVELLRQVRQMVRGSARRAR